MSDTLLLQEPYSPCINYLIEYDKYELLYHIYIEKFYIVSTFKIGYYTSHEGALNKWYEIKCKLRATNFLTNSINHRIKEQFDKLKINTSTIKFELLKRDIRTLLGDIENDIINDVPIVDILAVQPVDHQTTHE
jgi:hypothetical protein